MAQTRTAQFQRTYPAEPAQVGNARRALTQALDGHPAASDAVWAMSEFAANAVLHSDSRHGGEFTVRAEVAALYLRVEVEDAGGPWQPTRHTDGRMHGFGVVDALAGPGNWGIKGTAAGRAAWARFAQDRALTLTTRLDNGLDLGSDPRPHVRIAAYLLRQMEDGTLKPGDPVPSITVLAAQHGHCRQTCAKAMRLLEQAGILRNIPGHGYHLTFPADAGTS